MTELKNYLKPLKDKNAQLVTRYIKNWADSAKFKGCGEAGDLIQQWDLR